MLRMKSLSILDHSHYSLQHILADLRLNQSSVSFLETTFDFSTVSSNVDGLSLNGTQLEQIFVKKTIQVAKFDFALTFVYNSTLDHNPLSCSLVCSRDLFDQITVTGIAQRFEYFVGQLFRMPSKDCVIDSSVLPLKKLSVILPEEATEMQAMILRRMKTTVNEGM